MAARSTERGTETAAERRARLRAARATWRGMITGQVARARWERERREAVRAAELAERARRGT